MVLQMEQEGDVRLAHGVGRRQDLCDVNPGYATCSCMALFPLEHLCMLDIYAFEACWPASFA